MLKLTVTRMGTVFRICVYSCLNVSILLVLGIFATHNKKRRYPASITLSSCDFQVQSYDMHWDNFLCSIPPGVDWNGGDHTVSTAGSGMGGERSE